MKAVRLPMLAGAAALSACADMSAAGGGAASASTSPTASGAAAPASGASGAGPTAGGAAMSPTRTIVENASAALNLSTLARAIQAAGLATTLSGPGPFTVFAPTNEAFSRLQPGMVDTLLKPENRASLTKVLNYHVVPGAITAADLRARIQAGSGSANLTTAAGELLTARFENGAITLTDMNGARTYVETPDLRQSNGVVHVINGVLVPRLG